MERPVMELRESPLSSPPASPASRGELDYSVVLTMVQKINNQMGDMRRSDPSAIDSSGIIRSEMRPSAILQDW